MDYLIIKSIHIIFMVSYFAGIFYIVRLLVYHTEALKNLKDEPWEILHNQYIYMERRLWNIITIPAFVIMICTGAYMLIVHNFLLLRGWMHIKLLFLLILFYYHYRCWRIMKNLQLGRTISTSLRLRMLNEVATIILFSVVFTVTLKEHIVQNAHWVLISFFMAGGLIMLIVKWINRKGK